MIDRKQEIARGHVIALSQLIKRTAHVVVHVDTHPHAHPHPSGQTGPHEPRICTPSPSPLTSDRCDHADAAHIPTSSVHVKERRPLQRGWSGVKRVTLDPRATRTHAAQRTGFSQSPKLRVHRALCTPATAHTHTSHTALGHVYLGKNNRAGGPRARAALLKHLRDVGRGGPRRGRYGRRR